MSKSIKRQLICPNCDSRQKIHLFTAINATVDPSFKARILKEDIFDYKCKKCGYMSQMIYPIAYFDPKNNYVVALVPNYDDDDIFSNEKIDKFIKRRVETLKELKEKILIFDNDLNDLAVEMVKNNFLPIIKNKYHAQKIDMFFSSLDMLNNLRFALFIDDDEKAIYENIDFDSYKKSLEYIIKNKFQEPIDFLEINSENIFDIIKYNQTN